MAATHLIQKKGESTWYVRIIVPNDVRHAFGNRATLTRTTGTSNKAEAMDRRLPILAEWKRMIRDARKPAKVLTHFDYIVHSNSLTPWNPPSPIGLAPKWKQLGPPMLDGGAIKAAVESSLAYAANVAQQVKDLGSLSVPGLEPHIHQRQEELAGIVDDIGVSSPGQLYQELSDRPSRFTTRSPLTPSRLAAFRLYRENHKLPAKTVDQQESKLRKLSTYLTAEGFDLNHETVGKWLESLELSSKTKTQYLLAGSVFWKWAFKNDHHWKTDFAGQPNPFQEHDLPKVRGKAKVDASRKAFTVSEIVKIHSQAKTSHPALCPLIEIGSYTGLRIEEICKLKKTSIVDLEGIKCFSIEDSKTAAGIRDVPIHPSLLPLIDRLSSATQDDYLLPSSGGNKYGIRSDSYSKTFGRLKTDMGFGPRHVFHSIRMSVVTLLLRANVPGAIVANIVGHETGLVTYDVYDEGASPRQKLDALTHLSFNF